MSNSGPGPAIYCWDKPGDDGLGPSGEDPNGVGSGGYGPSGACRDRASLSASLSNSGPDPATGGQNEAGDNALGPASRDHDIIYGGGAPHVSVALNDKSNDHGADSKSGSYLVPQRTVREARPYRYRPNVLKTGWPKPCVYRGGRG